MVKKKIREEHMYICTCGDITCAADTTVGDKICGNTDTVEHVKIEV